MRKINSKIYIYSFGGCGTRTLYEWLKRRYSDINNQVDVHHGIPPKRLNENDRIIYLFGNPVNAITSFYRRNSNGIFIEKHCNNLKIKPFKLSLSDYSKQDKDLFQLREHFNKYTEMKNCILINYDKLWENLRDILTYLNLEGDIEEFPKKRERKSSNLLSGENRKKMEYLYNDLINDIEKISFIIK